MHDSKAAYLLMRVLKEMCSGVKVILADGGYRGELVNNIKKKFRYFTEEHMQKSAVRRKVESILQEKRMKRNNVEVTIFQY